MNISTYIPYIKPKKYGYTNQACSLVCNGLFIFFGLSRLINYNLNYRSNKFGS